MNGPSDWELLRGFLGARALGVTVRGLHIVAMGLLLGGVAAGGTYESLRSIIIAAIGSGVLLFLVDLGGRRLVLTRGSGAAMLLKLGLLGLGNVFPGRLSWYVAATFVASVGAHMPKTWRHFSVNEWLRARRQGDVS